MGRYRIRIEQVDTGEKYETREVLELSADIDAQTIDTIVGDIYTALKTEMTTQTNPPIAKEG